MKTAVGEAHSKLILAGEHAVVYGKPAIAMPFPLKVRAVIEEATGAISFESAIYTGPIEGMPEKMRGISACAFETLNYLKKPLEGLRISIDSDIPLGRGLGSSAAIAVALVRALFKLYGQEPSWPMLFSFVEIAETHAHGKPSGIDMAAVSRDCPIWFERGREIVPLKVGGTLYFVVADTGRVGDTRRAVENVRKRYNSEHEKVQKSLEEVGKIAIEARGALQEGNGILLGKLLSRNQRELITLGVSDEGLNALVEASLKAGALGAKLTGGGLGGCIIALAESLESAKGIAEELMKAGAVKSWYFSTGEDVLYVSGHHL